MTSNSPAQWTGLNDVVEFAKRQGVFAGVDLGLLQVTISTGEYCWIVRPEAGGWFARSETHQCSNRGIVVAPFYAPPEQVVSAVIRLRRQSPVGVCFSDQT